MVVIDTPILNNVDVFDANKDYIFNYTYLGTQRITTSQLSIREAVSGSEPIYTGQITKFEREHLLQGETIENGKEYWAKIRVLLDNGEWSNWSAEVSFLCLTTPVIRWDNIDDDNYIFNNDIMMSVVYFQQEGERIKQFRFSLLDENKNILDGNKFHWRKPDKNSPNVLSERIKGLVRGRLYYVGIRIQTVNGINYYETHELIPQFITPTINGVIELKNFKDSGQILVQSYLKQMLGSSVKPFIPNAPDDSGTNYSYWKDEWVIIPEEMPLIYEDLGMAKASDWILKSWQQNVLNGIMYEFTEELQSGIKIRFIKTDDCIIAEKEYNGIKSRTKSNIIEGLGLQPFYMFVRVKEHRIEIKIELIDENGESL